MCIPSLYYCQKDTNLFSKVPNTPQKPNLQQQKFEAINANEDQIDYSSNLEQNYNSLIRQGSDQVIPLSRFASEKSALELEKELFSERIPESQSAAEPVLKVENSENDLDEKLVLDGQHVEGDHSSDTEEEVVSEDQKQLNKTDDESTFIESHQIYIQGETKSPSSVSQSLSGDPSLKPAEVFDRKQSAEINSPIEKDVNPQQNISDSSIKNNSIHSDEVNPEVRPDLTPSNENEESKRSAPEIALKEKESTSQDESNREAEEAPISTNYSFPSSSLEDQPDKNVQSSAVENKNKHTNLVTSSFNLTKPMKSFIRRNGLRVQESVTDETDFVILGSPPLRRTHKFLLATSLGIPLVSSQYLTDCIKSGKVLDFRSYKYKDEEAEAKWGFRLDDIHRRTCFNGKRLYITKAIRDSMVGDSIHGLYSILETSGAEVSERWRISSYDRLMI